MKIIVIGAGAWGTALAVQAARRGGHAVELWARDPAQAAQLARTRENARYLPGIALPPALAVQSGTPDDLLAQTRAADLLLAAMPVAGLRATLTALRGCATPLAWLCKGFEQAAPDQGAALGLLPHEVQRQAAPELLAGSLSGPSFAQEVARGQPAALVAASSHAAVRQALVAALHGGTLRIYANDDLPGVEVGGAVKNVLAIATGLADGMQLGLNARAALITRGLAEMTRLGLALGARAETFMGLSGLGDLVLTATGDLSRNRQVGLQLAAGKTLAQAVQSLGHVAEGVACARTVVQRARHLKVEMPIAECVVALLDGQLAPAQAVAALMGRDPKGE
ncbi:MAG: NAD(P)-dependent glycerol-3-phosphate dehydrogenase [Burkholderiaceae bacterium]|jgi:glycerol-3-phosphate dehydrogenase (NAD(P)+)|nr:NAD(P)-dependent glycerol-3-phosphate dehydrogenase [Burkholderiaceae bacterium]